MSKVNKKAFSLLELSIVIIIISVVIAGVATGKTLVNKSRLATAQSMTISAPVPAIDNLLFWLDATSMDSLKGTDGLPLVDNGDPVQSWTDIHPNTKRKIVFATAQEDTYPLYKIDGLAGLPTLAFDGDNSQVSDGEGGFDAIGDYLTTANNMKITNPKDYSLFVVLIPFDKETIYQGTIITKEGPSGDVDKHPYGLFYESTTPEFTVRVANSDGADVTEVSASFNALAKPFLVTSINDSTDTTTGRKIYINGNVNASASSTTQNTFFQSNANLTIGRYSSSVGDREKFCRCNISEIIMYDRVLTAAERAEISDYLIRKWRLQRS